MHRIVKKTLQYTGFLFLSLIVLLIAGISYLYFSADMQTPKHEQSMTTDKVIDIDSLHLRHYGDNFLRHSDSGLWELFVKGDAFQRGEAIGQLSSDLLHHQEKVFVDQIREIVPSDSYLKFLRFFIVLFNRNLGENGTRPGTCHARLYVSGMQFVRHLGNTKCRFIPADRT